MNENINDFKNYYKFKRSMQNSNFDKKILNDKEDIEALFIHLKKKVI